MSRAPSPEADDNRDGDGDGDNDNEWRFDVDDVGPDGIVDDESKVEQLPVEPEPPQAENIMFVLFGALPTIRFVVVTVYPGAFRTTRRTQTVTHCESRFPPSDSLF